MPEMGVLYKDRGLFTSVLGESQSIVMAWDPSGEGFKPLSIPSPIPIPSCQSQYLETLSTWDPGTHLPATHTLLPTLLSHPQPSNSSARLPVTLLPLSRHSQETPPTSLETPSTLASDPGIPQPQHACLSR